MEPGTEVPVHRHPTKDESFVILRGKVRSTTYNDDGSIIDSVVLSQEDGVYGVDIPKGIWHKLESLETDSVIFECKEGPFVEHEEEGDNGGGITEVLRHGGMEMVKKMLKGIWEFCGYVFVPQRRPKDYYSL